MKPKTSFRRSIPTRYTRWAASHPTHIPRRPKKKPLRGEKVGFAEKKLRLWLAGLQCMATLGGGWIHPLVGTQYFAPASADGITIVQKTRAVGSEGRAQNIAPLQLVRCLIVACGDMGIPPIRCATVCSRRVFFRRSRLFFREATFFPIR